MFIKSFDTHLMRGILARWRILVYRLLAANASVRSLQAIMLSHHLAATNLDKRIVQRFYWILCEIEDFDNTQLHTMIGTTHVIAIGHLLIVNWCIDQLKKTLYCNVIIRAFIVDHVQQSHKDASAHASVRKRQFRRVDQRRCRKLHPKSCVKYYLVTVLQCQP